MENHSHGRSHSLTLYFYLFMFYVLCVTFRKMLRFFSKTNRPVVIAAFASGADVVHQFLLVVRMSSSTDEESSSMSNILGVVSIGPTYHDHVEFLSMPLLIIIMVSSSSSSNDIYVRNYLANPNAIVIAIDNVTVTVVQTKKEQQVESIRSSMDEDPHQTLWMARTIAKYAQASAAIQENDRHRTVGGNGGTMQSRL
jgi:hypothetical protein